MKNNKYEEFFSNWLNNYMPSSNEGMWISDIDYFLYDIKTSRFLMIELKTKNNDMSQWQKNFYKEIHKRLVKTNNDSKMKFVGTYLIQFEGTNFEDGNVYLSGSGIEKTMVFQESLQQFLYDKLGIGKQE